MLKAHVLENRISLGEFVELSDEQMRKLRAFATSQGFPDVTAWCEGQLKKSDYTLSEHAQCIRQIAAMDQPTLAADIVSNAYRTMSPWHRRKIPESFSTEAFLARTREWATPGTIDSWGRTITQEDADRMMACCRAALEGNGAEAWRLGEEAWPYR